MADASPMLTGGLSKENKERFTAVQERAKKLGVLDIDFDGAAPVDALEIYERALSIVEKNKALLDKNAGEE